MTRTDIIQFNCNGIRGQYHDIREMIVQYNPSVILLQELKMKKGHKIEFRGYTLITKYLNNETHLGASVGILIKNGLKFEVINTPVEWLVIGINIFIERDLSIFTYYDTQRLNNLTFNQLRTISTLGKHKAIIMGDFNTHSCIWDNNLRNRIYTSSNRDKAVLQFINDSDYVLMNDGKVTRISPIAENKDSAIDITLIHKELVQFYEWEVADIMNGSDHLACLLSSNKLNENLHKRVIWDLNTTNWDKFNSVCSFDEINDEMVLDEVDELIELQIKKALEASTKFYEYPFNKKRSPPWWDTELNELRKAKNKALTSHIRFKTVVTLVHLKRSNAKYRKAVKEKKRISWDVFIEEMNENLDSKELWNRIKKVKGSNLQRKIVQIKNDHGEMIDDQKEVVEILAKFFKNVSSKESLSEEQKENYFNLENDSSETSENNFENLDNDFSMQEFDAALMNTHDSAPGPDGFKYKIIKNMSKKLKSQLVNFYNRIWKEGCRPSSWKKSIIIPFIKQNFNFTPDGVRPINLINSRPKLFDKMVNNRLMFSLESTNVFSVSQYGFRRNQQTLDSMIVLDKYVRDSLKKSSHVNLISFDIKKAFDSIWSQAVLKKLNQINLGGCMYKYIKDFLSPRKFVVNNCGIESAAYEADIGVPQGSPLSSSLFILAFQHILDVLQDEDNQVKFSAYADDLIIYLERKECDEGRFLIQDTINKLVLKGNQFGLQFSTEKTKFIHICTKYSGCNPGNFTIYDSDIERVNNLRILGLFINKKWKFDSHIEQLKNKLIKDYNLYKMLSSKSFYINQDTLRKVVIALSISKIRYCIEVYGFTTGTNIKKIDVMLNKFKRLILRSFCTTPVITLTAQSNIPTFNMILEKSVILSYCKIIEDVSEDDLIENTRDMMIKNELEEMMLFNEENNVKEFVKLFKSKTLISPQKKIGAQIFENIFKKKKEEINSGTAEIILRDFVERNQIQEIFFTDGSKSIQGVSNAVVFQDNTIYSGILHPNSTIFTAEADAILFTVNLINEQFSGVKCAVVTDSMSVLEELKSVKNRRNEISSRIIEATNDLTYFIWVPSHNGVKGNDLADKAASEAFHQNLNDTVRTNYLYSSDFKSHVKKEKIKKNQKVWDLVTDNKFKEIHPSIDYEESWPIGKYDQINLNRLRAGHTSLTHRYLINHLPPPECEKCNQSLTVKHMFECNIIQDKSYISISKGGNWKLDLFDAGKFSVIKEFLIANGYQYLI